jgi:hypothetical protein
MFAFNVLARSGAVIFQGSSSSRKYRKISHIKRSIKIIHDTTERLMSACPSPLYVPKEYLFPLEKGVMPPCCRQLAHHGALAGSLPSISKSFFRLSKNKIVEASR